ncbi:MAG: hypothetical protein AMS19_01020 [Gemmatimonas sp. SG8_23]|nr:MAG: hypothetical protein AMS19_01020 [Gemmatimonas sp. SG8_23]
MNLPRAGTGAYIGHVTAVRLHTGYPHARARRPEAAHRPSTLHRPALREGLEERSGRAECRRRPTGRVGSQAGVLGVQRTGHSLAARPVRSRRSRVGRRGHRRRRSVRRRGGAGRGRSARRRGGAGRRGTGSRGHPRPGRGPRRRRAALRCRRSSGRGRLRFGGGSGDR